MVEEFKATMKDEFEMSDLRQLNYFWEWKLIRLNEKSF
ncbi:unnamed protein product [Brassica oleracea]